jgi:hypothetical protein
MKIFKVISLFILVLFSATIVGQEKTKEDFSAKVFVEKGKILIRWVPTNKQAFDLAKKYGYKIDRIKLSDFFVPKDTSGFGISYKVNSIPIVPFSENDKSWVYLLEENQGTALVYDALFKKNSTTEKTEKEKENAENMKFGLVLLSCDLSLDLAKATGLFIEDSKIDNKAIYAYRISIAAPKGTKYKPYLFSVDAKQLTKLSKIKNLKSKPGVKSTKLTWNVSENKHDYTGYIFERSTDSVNFERTNKTPFVFMTSQYNRDLKEGVYTDSLPQNGVVYYYRVRGLSHFGVLGPPSNVVKCIGKSGFRTYPYVDSVITIKNKTINVYFHLPNYSLNKLKGFCVYRASSIDGKYELITKKNLPNSTIIFTDEKPMMANYYKVFAINTENDSVSSHPSLGQLADEEPPAVPSGLVAKIDTAGKVILSWNKNTEKDLKGYRVYKMNILSEEPVEVVSKFITENDFTDSITLQTLTEEIYYTINAVDNSYNNSKQCTPIKLKKPDRIPPVNAIITKLYHTDTTLVLKWINSTSKDVLKTELYQINNLKKVKVREFCIPDTTNHYTDYLIEMGQSYSYELVTFDDDGNKSIATSNQLLFETGVRPKIQAIEYTVNYETKSIELKWQYSQKDLYSFIIYKSKGDSKLYTYKTLNPNQFQFTDKDLDVSNIYRYKIKAIFNSGAESIISDAVEIKY